MKECCRAESAKSLQRHRDVATCDACGALLLAYGNDIDFQRTVEELDKHGVDYRTDTLGKLKIVAKATSKTH
jgi:hypothetical protein